MNGIYLDYNATTPVAPEVFEAMSPYFQQFYGNPASGSHSWGWMAENAVSKARTQVAKILNCSTQEITFTSGATESNNLAILGLIKQLHKDSPSQPIHIITSVAEHKSVSETFKAAQEMGVEVEFLPVDQYGRVNVESVLASLKPHTKLMSLMWINNEVGSFNPIEALGRIAKEKQIYFHCDATQAVGKIPVDVQAAQIDLLSLSAHKMYGPKGVGALYVRHTNPRVQLQPLIYGGGQERNLRSGTLNVPGIVGLGKAAELCMELLPTEYSRLTEMREQFWRDLKSAIPALVLNGHPQERAANNLNLQMPKNLALTLGKLQGVAFSAGSACGSGSVALSPVLKGMGLSTNAIERSIRLSFGRYTTTNELKQTVEIFEKAFTH